LGGNAGALAQQEHFVGETLGIGELGIAAVPTCLVFVRSRNV
jgi:hypothetical protein